MTALPVEWVIVIYYGPTAHRATYGRLGGTKYTKDYIQLSRKTEFKSALASLFPTMGNNVVPLTYKWFEGTASGQIIFHSADRPHLAWETRDGAPAAWKMSVTPSDLTAETIPGNPDLADFEGAEEQLALLASQGIGQPYLMAIKLRGEARTLHLRAYIKKPNEDYHWADIKLAPAEIQALAAKTSKRPAMAWSTFQSGGTAPSAEVAVALDQLATSSSTASAIDALDAETALRLASYLKDPAYGLFFDPIRNHDAWVQPNLLPEKITSSIDDFLAKLRTRFPLTQEGDALAETMETSAEEVETFIQQIKNNSYEVNDTYATAKTRGSAQRAFAKAVKGNYGSRCAITGIDTKDFLVAAHIVPWSLDQTIRLDPSNGICLSILMDRAFEYGYLTITDDLTITVNLDKIGSDIVLKDQLKAYQGQKVSAPSEKSPRPEYLQRRRELN